VIHHAKQIHYDGAKGEECIIQVWGMGPATSIPAEKKMTKLLAAIAVAMFVLGAGLAARRRNCPPTTAASRATRFR